GSLFAPLAARSSMGGTTPGIPRPSALAGPLSLPQASLLPVPPDSRILPFFFFLLCAPALAGCNFCMTLAPVEGTNATHLSPLCSTTALAQRRLLPAAVYGKSSNA
ncbi:uncharacterized protein Tco025E_09728, partial [Trypanosoma conorhini]